MQTLRRAQVTEAFGYLLKPFEERELQITIEMALYKHRMESRLRDSEQRYRNFFEEALTGNYRALADGTIVDCNDAFVSILRFPSKAEVKGANLHALYPDHRSLVQFLEHLTVNRRLTYYEKELRSVDGRRVHVIENAIAEMDGEGKLLGYKGYMFDDTVRKRLEEQLQQSHKMESVGTMASGIAHDFNNIINNVLGFATQLTKHVHDPVKVLKYAQTIEKSATRGAELSAQLLTFARVGQRENRPPLHGNVSAEHRHFQACGAGCADGSGRPRRIVPGASEPLRQCTRCHRGEGRSRERADHRGGTKHRRGERDQCTAHRRRGDAVR
jgi:PAS domain S-box-containing protein